MAEIWLGSEESHSLACGKVKLAEDMMKNSVNLASSSNFDPVDMGLLTISEGGIGVINVVGPLITNGSWFTALFGVIGYNQLRDTLVIAAQDDSISNIVLNIDSPGGSANGINAVSSLISKIDKDHKPVMSYTDGKMCSAAYWIASASRSIYSDRLAEVGSIGVITSIMEYTKALEMDGVTATVIRSGEFKALGGPLEVLTPEAESIIQDSLDKFYTEFINQVSMNRGLSTTSAKTSWAEGRVFLGFEAQDVGLVDRVMSFEDLASSLYKAPAATTSRVSLSNGGPDMAKKILTEQAAAIIATTGDVSKGLDAINGTDVIDENTDSTEELTGDVADDVSNGESEASGNSDLTSYLQKQLSSEQEKTISLTIEKRELQAKIDLMEASHAQFKEIAVESINMKSLAIGRAGVSAESMTDEMVLSTYASVKNAFSKAFPIGGVSPNPSTEVSRKPMTNQQRRAVNASKL